MGTVKNNDSLEFKLGRIESVESTSKGYFVSVTYEGKSGSLYLDNTREIITLIFRIGNSPNDIKYKEVKLSIQNGKIVDISNP